MKYILIVILISRISFGQTPINDPHWQILWEDKFDAPTINTNYWKVLNDYDHYGELEVFRSDPDNVFVNNGNLSLRLKNDNYSCPTSALNIWGCKRQFETGQSYLFTSGWVETQIPYNIHYGFIEARIKLPNIIGIWPALWTFSGMYGYQEIDIFEMIPGSNEKCHRSTNEYFLHTNNIMTSNIHFQPPNGCDDPFAIYSVSQIQDFSQWHTYAIEWSPSRIIWYLDDYPVRYYRNTQMNAPTTLIMGLGIQRDENGNPRVSSSNLPVDMVIDFIKVYQLNTDCEDFINTSNYDFSTYNNVEKNFIKIGQGGGNNTLGNTDDIKLRASQFIELSGEFLVPLGASLYADASKDCPIDLGFRCTQTFNPCTYDFSHYENTIKRIIEIGGNGCQISITPNTNNIALAATDEILLKPGITITSTTGKLVDLRIVSCQ